MRVRLLLWDLVAVFGFVVVGRQTHEEALAPGRVLETAAPFLAALVLGWVAASRADAVSPRGGAIVAGVTIVAGLVLRRLVFDDGIAATFIVVTTAVLGSAMIGWRLVVAWRESRRAAGAASRGHS